MQIVAWISTFAPENADLKMKGYTCSYGKNIQPGLTCLALLLLILYAIGTLETGTLHNLIHARENAELHSPENEKNPCHRAIYHHSHGCHHASHVSELKTCPLCDLVVHSEHLPVTVDFPEHHQFPISRNTSLFSFVFFDGLSLLPSRAPPIG